MGMRRILLNIIILLSILIPIDCIAQSEIYVVSVGISDYKNISDLRLPEQDAKAVAKLYKTKTKHVILITGRYATKERILQSLRDQFSRADEDDIIVFSFSGHGYQGGICPYDMTNEKSSGITYQEIRNILKQSQAKSKMIFADACFSGGIRSGNESNNSSYNDESNVLLFLSSRGGETSIESPFMVNGVFTNFLIRGLRGGADYNLDRKITAKELFDFVHQGVVEKSSDKQHPVMWGRFDNDAVMMDWR